MSRSYEDRSLITGPLHCAKTYIEYEIKELPKEKHGVLLEIKRKIEELIKEVQEY